MIVNETEKQTEDHTVETQYLMSVLIGSFGPLVGEKLAKNASIGNRVNISAYYKIEIFYKDEEDKRFVFQSYENPSDFFQKYNNILEIK